MNILEIQQELEYWPDQKLIQEAQQPTGAAPTYLVVTEGERRNKERQAYEAEMAKQQQPQPTVAEETMMELGGGQSMGGIPDVDPNMMQNQMMAQQQMPQNSPMPMREGGNIRYQEGEDIDFDETGGFIRGPLGNKMLGKDGWLYDPSSKLDNVLLAASAIPIGGRLVTGAGLLGKAGIKGAVQGAKALKGKIAEKAADPIKNLLEGIGSFSTKRLGFNPSYGGAGSIPIRKVGEQAINPKTYWDKGYFSPRPLSLSSPFWSTTAPVAGGVGLLAGGGGEDSGIGTESDASIIEAVNAEEANAENISIDDMTIEELQALIAEREAAEAERMRKLTEKLEIEKETKRREALPDSARMLEDAMANVPENTTFQDYLSTLEGMEESRKGQVLMDLGAAIANASHGGDIAKGFQEAGTKARAEKIEVAKETARVLGESRAMDIDVAIKMATIQADIESRTGRTLQELLRLLQIEGVEFLTENYPDSAGSILAQIEEAIKLTLPPVPEKKESPE